MTTSPRFRLGAAALLASAIASVPAHAAMGNIATNYGILPADVGSAQGLSLFNSSISSLHYNPAYLTTDSRGELTLGLLHGDQELRARSLGGSNPVQRDGRVLNDTDSQQVVIGFKTDMSGLTTFEHPIYFGILVGIERYGDELLAFESRTADEGQFFSYGRQPLFLQVGGATELLHGINAGASVNVTLQANANMRAVSNLAGDTSREDVRVSANPIIRPVLSTNLELDKIFCGRKSDCGIFSDVEMAFAFRGRTKYDANIDANITIPGTVPEPGIDLMINTIDSYTPDIYVGGIHIPLTDNLRVAASLEWQRWEDLGRRLSNDTVREVAEARFRDITVPRVGLEWQATEALGLTAGFAYQESALRSVRTPDVNYFDNDKTIIGVGASYTIQEPPVLMYPVRFDFGYQYQMLDDRNFELSTTRPAVDNPFEVVRTDGDVHVFSGSVTLKF